MDQPTLFTHPIFTEIILPFLLIFVVLFGILQKTKIFGDGKKQIDALVSFTIALIFVSIGVLVPMVNMLVLYFVISIIIILIFMIMYGFVSSEKEFKPQKWMMWIFGILIGISLIAAVLFASGKLFEVVDLLFYSSWSGALWANIFFIIIIAGAMALVLRNSK